MEAEALLKEKGLHGRHTRVRPDLWHAWAALVSQLGHMQKLDEALILAKQAAARFAHLPRVRLLLAGVYGWRKGWNLR